MPAIILAPLEGDSVASPVTVSSSYDFTSTANMACFVGADGDGASPLSGSNIHNGTVTTAATGPQTVAVKVGTTTLDTQPNVNITGAPAPIIINGLSTPTAESTRRTFIVSGECDPNVTPALAFVVCIGYSVDPDTNTRTPVAIGFDIPTGGQKRWQVRLQIEQVDGLRYIARAFLFDYTFEQIGAFTKVLD